MLTWLLAVQEPGGATGPESAERVACYAGEHALGECQLDGARQQACRCRLPVSHGAAVPGGCAQLWAVCGYPCGQPAPPAQGALQSLST